MSAPELLSPIPQLLAYVKSDPQRVITRDGKDVFVARAPGRLDVMGGIADYTGSLVCEMPIDLAAAVAVQRRDDRKIVLSTYNDVGHTGAGKGAPARMELSLDDFYGTAALLPTTTVQSFFTGDKHWGAYVAGAYWQLSKHRKLNRRATGANIAVYSQVPLGAGVSSSAALEVAAINALTAAYHLILEPLEAAVIAQRVENQIAGSPCGVMDQVTSMLGHGDELLLMRCQPHTVEGFLPIPQGLQVVGINSNLKHSVGGSAYRNTRVAAFMAQAIIAKCYKDLGVRNDPSKGYLANISKENYQAYFRRILPVKMAGRDFSAKYEWTVDRVTTVDANTVYDVRAAADHHVLENQRVEAFVAALKMAGNNRKALLRAGRLMYASHASYGQRAKMGSKETDILVDAVKKLGPGKGFYGAKITGGGSGGTVAVLCDKSAAAAAHLGELAKHYTQKTELEATLITGTSAGAAQTPPQRITANEV